MENKMKSKN